MLYLHRIFNSIWLMDANYATNFLPLISAYIRGESPKQINHSGKELTSDTGIFFATRQRDMYHISDYGCYSTPEDAPDESIAVISINGAITKYDQNCGPSGMQTKSNLLTRCYQNDKIKGIVIRQDTGGGEGGAMRLLNQTIINRNKPVIGFVDDNSCSAGYGNFSACDLIIANSNLARIGSIGTYLTIADYTEHFKKEGINLIEIYATASTDKNKEYYEALKGNLEPLREIADTYNNAFLKQIEMQRGVKLTADNKVWGTGKVFFADKALELGLIDGIDSFDNILNYFNT